MAPSLNLILRDAQPTDRAAIAEILAATFSGSPLARHFDPDPGTRVRHCRARLDDEVADALNHGVVRLAEEGGGLVAAALWLPCAKSTDDPPGAIAPVAARFRELERLLDRRRPRDRRYHHLTYLGVRPGRRRLGIGSHLLDAHHALLDADGIPAYLEADDPRSRRLWLRHGYTDVGAPVLVPGSGCPIWPMWRHPDPLTTGREAS